MAQSELKSMNILIFISLIFLISCGPSIKDVTLESETNSSLSDPTRNPDSVEIPPALDPLTPDAETSAWVSFKMGAESYSLAHGPANFWEGCEIRQNVKGGYSSDSICGRAYFHPKFSSVLNKNFYSCAQDAAKKAAIAPPKRIFIKHFGSYNDRNGRGSASLSMHAYARALDIVNFNLYDANNVLTRISTHVRDYKGKTALFYDQFRECWRKTMPTVCKGKSEGMGSIGHPDSDLGGNTLHNDHIHLSLPLCAG